MTITISTRALAAIFAVCLFAGCRTLHVTVDGVACDARGAPTNLAWGHDNRTCGFRIVGHGGAKRVETRIPGGDVNPYLAFAAIVAAGLHGIENELPLPPPLEGNAYESDAERFPHSLREAIAALEEGAMARAALGDDVVDHYLNYARTEQRLFDEAVTCYERERFFERG